MNRAMLRRFFNCLIAALLVVAGSLGNRCSAQSPATSTAQQETPHVHPAPGESQEDADRRYQHAETEEPERMSLEAPKDDALLGNPTPIVIKLAPGKVTSVQCWQSQGNDGLGGGVTEIVTESDGSKAIEIMPLRLGVVDVTVVAIYLDNAIATQTTHLNVVPTANQLRKFELNQGFNSMDLFLDGEEYQRISYMMPLLDYEKAGLVHLKGFSQIKLSISQDESNPVVRVDSKTGAVTALREGEANIVGEFCGVTDKIHVEVRRKQ